VIGEGIPRSPIKRFVLKDRAIAGSGGEGSPSLNQDSIEPPGTLIQKRAHFGLEEESRGGGDPMQPACQVPRTKRGGKGKSFKRRSSIEGNLRRRRRKLHSLLCSHVRGLQKKAIREMRPEEKSKDAKSCSQGLEHRRVRAGLAN